MLAADVASEAALTHPETLSAAQAEPVIQSPAVHEARQASKQALDAAAEPEQASSVHASASQKEFTMVPSASPTVPTLTAAVKIPTSGSTTVTAVQQVAPAHSAAVQEAAPELASNPSAAVLQPEMAAKLSSLASAVQPASADALLGTASPYRNATETSYALSSSSHAAPAGHAVQMYNVGSLPAASAVHSETRKAAALEDARNGANAPASLKDGYIATSYATAREEEGIAGSASGASPAGITLVCCAQPFFCTAFLCPPAADNAHAVITCRPQTLIV